METNMNIQEQLQKLKDDIMALEKITVKEEPSSIILPGAPYVNYIHPYTGQYVIVRSYGSGCHCGILKSFDPYTGVAFLKSVRRLWYWDKAFTLSEVALRGIGGESKIPDVLEEFTVCNILELIPATDEAIKKIINYKVTKYGD